MGLFNSDNDDILDGLGEMDFFRGLAIVGMIFVVIKVMVKIAFAGVLLIVKYYKGRMNWFGTIAKNKALAFVPLYSTFAEYSKVMNGFIGILKSLCMTAGIFMVCCPGYLRVIGYILITGATVVRIIEAVKYNRKYGKELVSSVFIFSMLRFVYYLQNSESILEFNQHDTCEMQETAGNEYIGYIRPQEYL